MATDNNDWESSGATLQNANYLNNDAQLQLVNASWPTGGTASQINTESGGNPTAVSPAGARGLAQIMPSTQASLEKRIGRKLDPTDPTDALQMQYEVMKENLQKFGNPADALKAYNGGWNPDKWSNPETAAYPGKVLGGVTQPAAAASSDDSGWESAPAKATKTDDGWESAPTGPTSSTTGAFARGAEKQALPTAAGVAAFGPGFAAGAAAGALTGPLAPIASPVLGIAGGLATSMGAGALAGKAQDYLLNEFPNAANAIGLGKEQQQADQTQHPIASFAGGLAPQLAFMRPGAGADLIQRGVGAAIGGGQEAASEYIDNGQLDPTKIGLATGAGALMNKTTALGRAMPFSGSHGQELTGDAAREMDKVRNTETPQPTTQADMDSMLADSDAANGTASPYEPNRMSEDVQSQLPTKMNDRRQMELTDSQGPDQVVNSDGDVMASQEQADQIQNIKDQQADATSQRVADFNADPAQHQADLFSEPDQHPYDQYGPDAEPRVLTPDEFSQTMDTLAKTDGTRMEPLAPEEVQGAYDRYLETTSDKQGGLFDRPTIAANFADEARSSKIDEMVNNHPIVKANTKKVAQAQARLDAQTQAPGGVLDSAKLLKAQDNLQAAKDTLEKSQTNIRNGIAPSFNGFARADKDGVVYLNAGIPLPPVMKHIGQMLRGIHGVVFKTLNKFVKPPTQINGIKDILQSSIANHINKEANRDWTPKTDKVVSNLGKLPGVGEALKEFTPFREDMPYEQVQKYAQESSDINSNVMTRNVAQGGLMMTNITKNPVIKYVYENVDNAVNKSAAIIRNMLTDSKTGLRNMVGKLSQDELTSIWTLMDKNEGSKLFSEAELKHQGFNDKQVALYKRFQEVMNQTYQRVSQAREAAGLAPMDRRTAYVASRLVGDWRQLVYNKDGEVVGFLGHQSRQGLGAISRWIQQNHPEYTLGDVSMQKLSEGEHSMNPFMGYQEALNALSKTNADVKGFVDTYQQYLSRAANTIGGVQNHAKYKKDTPVFGADGKKAWVDARENARQGFVAQMKYVESANRWVEMQQAADKSKRILSDETINQPNAKNWAQQYLDQAMGRRKGAINAASNAIVNSLAQTTGMGPSWWTGVNNTTKSLMLTKFIGIMKLSHSLVTLYQPVQAIPPIQALLKSRGLDGAGTLMPQAVAKGIASSTNLWRAHLTNHTLTDPFEIAADKYANEMGVYNTNMSTHLGAISNTPMAKLSVQARHAAELNVTVPEAGTRSFVYMMYSHLLKDAGMDAGDIFPTAAKLVKYAMVDYSPHERPLMFGKMGMLGDIASTLTRFKYNQISQHIAATNDSKASNGFAPILSMIASTVVAGGLRGVFGYAVANEFMDWLTPKLVEAGIMKQPTNLDQMVMKNFGKYANFGIFAGMGLNMTGSLSMADAIPDDPLGELFPTGGEIQKMFESSYNLAKYHDKTAGKQWLTQMAPNSMKGILENTMWTDRPDGSNFSLQPGKFISPNDLQYQDTRSTADQVKRMFSFRPLEESAKQMVTSTGKGKQQQWDELKQGLMEKAKMDWTSTGKLDNLPKYAEEYAQYGGDPAQFVNALTTFIGQGQNMTRLQRAEGIPQNIGGVARYQELQQLKNGTK